MSVNNSEYAVLVAGGSGTRMQSQLPKQFISIAGQPILMHTMAKFFAAKPELQMVVVLPIDQMATWQQLCTELEFNLPHRVVAGGATRFASVKNGLAAITGEGIVAIHDGVRPFVPIRVIQEAFATAAEKGNAVATVPLKESIRHITEDGSEAIDRKQYRLVQTPQCFRLTLLRQAYQLPEESAFTDDATVVERLGEKIYLVPGAYENVKITTPEDLAWAESFWQQSS